MMQVNQVEDLANLAAAYESGIDPFAFEHPSDIFNCVCCGRVLSPAIAQYTLVCDTCSNDLAEVDADPVDLYGGDYQDDQPEWMQ